MLVCPGQRGERQELPWPYPEPQALVLPEQWPWATRRGR